MSPLLRVWLAVSSLALLGTACGLAPAAAAEEPTTAEFEMQVYPLVLLKAGPRRGEELTEDEATRLQAAHIAHIDHMAELGHLLLAGPMLDRPGDDPIIGILVFRPGREEQAQALPLEDPLVLAGRLRVEFLRWYGPAGLSFPADPGPPADLAPSPH